MSKGKVRLENVRLAFPNLFDAKQVNDQGQAKYRAAFLFPPDHPVVAKIKEAMAAVAKDKWDEKAAEVYKALKAKDKLALHDGATKAEYAGYEGNLFLNASNVLKPTTVDGNRSPLGEADGKPYSGCYVNAVVEIWAQDSKHGKRINASLMGVQFYKDGERLAGGAVASEDDFEEIPDADTGSVFDESAEGTDNGDSEDSVFD